MITIDSAWFNSDTKMSKENEEKLAKAFEFKVGVLLYKKEKTNSIDIELKRMRLSYRQIQRNVREARLYRREDITSIVGKIKTLQRENKPEVRNEEINSLVMAARDNNTRNIAQNFLWKFSFNVLM